MVTQIFLRGMQLDGAKALAIETGHSVIEIDAPMPTANFYKPETVDAARLSDEMTEQLIKDLFAAKK